jgi:hypothetical protein
MRSLLIGLCTLAVLMAPAIAQTPPTQKLRLTQNTVQLAPGETAGTVTVTVLATLGKEDVQPEGSQAWLTDITAASTGVSVKTQAVKTTGELSQTWRFPVAIHGLQRAESQSRVFLVTYGTLREALPYTLSNTTQREFEWTVQSSPEWNLATMAALPLAITVGDVPATNVSLHHAVLTGDDKLRHTLGTEHFLLCTAAADRCQPTPAALASRVPHTLYVRPNGTLPVGTFKGNLLIAAAEKTDPAVLALTVYSPHPDGLLLGVAALAAGVLISLFLQVFGRSWIQQKSDRLAIAMLRKRLTDTEDEFKKLPAALRAAAEAWTKRADDLKKDMKELDSLVRSKIPQPFADEVASVETLKAALERHGKTVSLLRQLLRDGLRAVAAILERKPDARAAAEETAAAIASISAVENAATLIADELTKLRKAAQDAGPPLLAAAGGRRADSVSTIKLEVAAASLIIWFVWALIAVLSGALLLIYQNPAFGTDYDLLVCLAWGIGVSIAGQQATQVNPGGVAQSIGIKLPGAK